MSLFPKADRSRFIEITGSRYDSLKKRVLKLGVPALPFTKEQFRQHILDTQMDGGSTYDMPIRCPHCRGMFALEDCEGDHITPIARGGSLQLGNLRMICADDNAAKGEMTGLEYDRLLVFLHNELPLAYEDVFHRLKTWRGLVSTARAAQVRERIAKGKGPKKKLLAAPPMAEAIDKKF